MTLKRILVVDDHAEVADAMVFLIQNLGYRADAVLSGEAALRHVHHSPPDLLLVDLQMPGVNGWDVLQTLRADHAFDGLPIVVCSAAPSAQFRSDALRRGAQDYLSKDDAFEQLGRMIERCLGAGPFGAGITPDPEPPSLPN